MAKDETASRMALSSDWLAHVLHVVALGDGGRQHWGRCAWTGGLIILSGHRLDSLHNDRHRKRGAAQRSERPVVRRMRVLRSSARS
jgi:hypothetical protein